MPKATKPTSDTSTTAKTEPQLILDNSSVTVTLPWSDLKPAYQKHLANMAKNIKIDGFRKGKVPPALAESHVDQEHLIEHTLQSVLPKFYLEELKKTNQNPITQPEIEPIKIKKGEDWQIKLHFAIQPTVKLGDYKAIVKKAKKAAEKELAEIAKEKAVKAKEEKSAEAKPADAHEDQHAADDTNLKHIFRDLVTSIQPGVQELLIRQEVNRELQQLARQLEQVKIPVEQYLASRKMDVEQLRQEYAAIAVSTLQLEFIMAEIAKTENITVPDEELKKALADVEKQLGTTLSPDSPYRSYIFSSLIKQKVTKHLLAV